jgi:SepF-like predicted cell division protein (DUF552 family)
MKALKRIFGGEPKQLPEAIAEEVPILEIEEAARVRGLSEVEPIYVKSMDLRALADVQEAADELRAGNIVILDITQLMDQDPAELKRAVDQLKGITQGVGGDIGRLTESKVIATPKFVRIQFKKTET